MGWFLFTKKTYQKCSSLYDFCRTVDNIADDDGELDIKKKNLLIFKNDFLNKNYSNIIIKNMWDLMDHHLISIKIIEDLFDGVESDLNKKVQLNNKKDLLYKTTNKNYFSILLALGIIIWITQAVRLLDLIIEDGNSLSVYFLYILLFLPKIISKMVSVMSAPQVSG